MSLNNVERVFWEFGDQPSRIEQFRADPDAYLAAYALDEEECREIKDMNLTALVERGVSSLLAIMIWPLLKGPEGMPFAYLEHMNGGKMPGPPSA